MTKYSGVIGIKRDPEEVEPGIFRETIDEIPIRGELQYKPVRWRSGELSQDSVTANHVVSIITPESMMDEFSGAVYLTWMGRRWTITSIEYSKPRINFVLGGAHHV